MGILDPKPVTKNAADAAYALKSETSVTTAPTTGESIRAGISSSRSVAVTGHSLPYGQDTTAGGTTPSTNGASQSRSTTPPTTVLANQGAFISAGGAVSVVNQTFPGDRTTEALTRWENGSSATLEIFWLDTNDGNNYGGYASGTLTDAQTAANLTALIKRARSRGADVVVVGGAPVEHAGNSRRVFAAAETERAIAERLGARYIDAGEILTGLPHAKSLWTDGVHLGAEAYALMGGRLAALLGPKGVNAPKAHPGRIFTTRDQGFVGGTVTTTADTTIGKTLTVAAGATMSFAVNVEQPVIPVIRFYASATTGAGVAGIYSNTGVTGHPTRFAKITAPASANGLVHVVGVPLLSPGPDSIVIKAESGPLEIDSIQFVPYRRAGRTTGTAFSMEYGPFITGQLHPVGGVGTAKLSATWETMYDPAGSASIATGAAGTTKVSARWVFDLTLGATNCGVLLAHGIRHANDFGLNTGYMLLRNGANLIIRRYNEGATDTTVAGVFPASGISRNLLEVNHDAATGLMSVYVDGVAAGAAFAPAFEHFTPGLIAAGGGYASGQYSVARVNSGQTV